MRIFLSILGLMTISFTTLASNIVDMVDYTCDVKVQTPVMEGSIAGENLQLDLSGDKHDFLFAQGIVVRISMTANDDPKGIFTTLELQVPMAGGFVDVPVSTATLYERLPKLLELQCVAGKYKASVSCQRK